MSKARLVITAVVVQGLGVRETARSYNVSPSWISRLVARYQAEGEVAFEPRSRRPRHQSTAIPAATAELIIRLRRQLTRQGLDAGAHTIAWHLAEQHSLTVSVATIWRTLKRAGLIVSEPKKKPKASYVRFQAEQPNQMWQTDFTHYRLTRPDRSPGADVEILCFLDDHSRYALSVTCHQPVTGPAVIAAFRQAVADQGIPASVLSDNGMVYTTRFAGGRAGRDTLTASKPNSATSAWCRNTPNRTTPPPAAKSVKTWPGAAPARSDSGQGVTMVSCVRCVGRVLVQRRGAHRPDGLT